MSTLVTRWNDKALEAIRLRHPGPPMVARQLAILHTCIYDAWAAYDNVAVGTRLDGFLRRPPSERTQANRKKAVSFAAYRALADLFPLDTASFDGLMAELSYDPTDTALDPTTASGVGNLAAKAVLDFRHGDGSNQLGDLHPGEYSDYTGYVSVNPPEPNPVVDPNHWQRLLVDDGSGNSVLQPEFIGPHWGLVTPFALSFGDQFRPGPPAPFASHEYRQQAREVVHFSAQLNDRRKVIAEYWADGPSSELPPGHWTLFAKFVSDRDGHGLGRDVKMFFAMTNAVFDASIACWDSKRAFDYVRPITAVHVLFAGTALEAWAGPGMGTQVIDGADWRPYQAVTIVTPPFAEFVSGHSAFSAAAAEILKRFTGSDEFGGSFTKLAGTSVIEPGTPASDVTLNWATFTKAADEAGISRRYGGIHFAAGDLEGRMMGRLVGRQAWAKAQAYITGTA
jgi:hypothetical protein